VAISIDEAHCMNSGSTGWIVATLVSHHITYETSIDVSHTASRINWTLDAFSKRFSKYLIEMSHSVTVGRRENI